MTVFNLGKGAVLSVLADGATSAAIPVKQLKTISFAGSSANYEDVTNMDSPNLIQEFAPTTTTSGTAAFSGVFNDNDPGQIFIAAAKVAQTLLDVTIQFLPKRGQTTGLLRSFKAYVQECNSGDAQFDKASTISGTFKITGGITDVAGAA